MKFNCERSIGEEKKKEKKRKNLVEISERRKRIDARPIADANKSTNGIGCSLTIRTTIARASSWTGSCFLLVAYADAIHPTTTSFHQRIREINYFSCTQKDFIFPYIFFPFFSFLFYIFLTSLSSISEND